MAYIAHTQEDRKRMYDALGISSFDDLLTTLPESLRLNRLLRVPPAAPEWEVAAQLQALAGKNTHTEAFASFLGAGAYDHFVPSAVGHITSRSEFSTAYTPYQAEVSQGTLQSIFEFQTAIARLVAMPLANASLYDGASACAEAVLLCRSATGGHQVLMSESVHPHTRAVVHTYLKGFGIKPTVIKATEGITDPAAVNDKSGKKPACLVVSQPNVFGQIEDITKLAECAHEMGALLVVCVDPIAMGVLEAPGHQQADVIVGEGQSLGISQSFGGPYLGFMAARESLLRRMPGRLIGLTVDCHGTRSYVMTLQTREQHIRRERATSNICTNQGLCALAATVYMSLLGKTGLQKAAHLSMQKAHYLADRLCELTGFKLRFTGPFFKEFVLEMPASPSSVIRKLNGERIFAGVDLSRLQGSWRGGLLVAVTEKRSRGEMDRYIEGLKSFSARAEIALALARELAAGDAPTVSTSAELSGPESEAETEASLSN